MASNAQIWEICWETDCHLVNVIYYLKCKMCDEKEPYTGKTKGDNRKGFKVKINKHISDCKAGDSKCTLLRHVYDSATKNNCLEEPFLRFTMK